MDMFGPNGVRLDLLNDEQLKDFVPGSKKRTLQHIIPVAVGILLLTSQSFLIIISQPELLKNPLHIGLMLLCAVFVLIPGFVAFDEEAKEQGRYWSWSTSPNHISGTAIIVSASIIAVVWLVARFMEQNYGDLRINDRAGALVVGLIALAFASLIIGPRFANSARLKSAAQALQRSTDQRTAFAKSLDFIGKIASTVDAFLVYLVAPTVGITQERTAIRYLFLAAHILPCTLMAWYLPAPLGLVPIAWAFIAAISVARRWAWVEEDRDVALRQRRFDDRYLRVGLDEDLRDEALLALMSLILLLPLSMRQLHFSLGDGSVFEVSAELANNPVAWVQFFGVELAKAIPFVDWADIYDVQSNASIAANSALASHIVFVARAIVDLIFLATLLQALSVAMKWSRHKQMFFNKEIDRLDRMIERLEFEQLAYRKNGTWYFPDRLSSFEHYNEYTLRDIRNEARKQNNKTMFAVATEILNRRGEPTSSLSEQLSEAVFRKSPDLRQIQRAFDRARDAGQLELADLVAARTELNRKSTFNALRYEIVEAIIAQPLSDQRTTALRHILVDNKIADSRKEIRLLTISPLWAAVQEDGRALETLKRAAGYDRAAIVRNAARKFVNEADQVKSIVQHIADRMKAITQEPPPLTQKR